MGESLNGDTIETDVAIVGGGIAGLTAAVGLSETGLDTLVIEKNDRLGGRARSWEDPKTGDPVHIGPHIFMSEYPNMLKLLDTLGTEDRVVWQKDRFITMVDGRKERVMKQYPLPAPFQYSPALFTELDYSYFDVASNTMVMLYAMQMDEKDVMHLDRQNAYSFLRSLGVTETAIEELWQFTCMAIMNVPVQLCSAGALMRFFKRFIGYNNYEIGFPDGGLGDIYTPEARRRIEDHGGRIMLNTAVEEIAGTPGEADGVRLEDGRLIEADRVIAAVPPQVLRDIARSEWIKEYDEFRELVHFDPCPYVSPYLWFDRKLTDQAFWARSYSPNDLNCDFYDMSNINSGWENRDSVITSNIIYSKNRGADEMSDDEIVERTVAEISEYLPEVAEAEVIHSVVNRIPMAIHCPYPGTEQRRPDTDCSIENLFLAGDFIDTGLPSSMESAAKSGWLSAEHVLDREGFNRKLSVELKPVEGITGVVDKLARNFPPKKLYQWVRYRVDSLLGGSAA
ncbi:MAG: FAD-dependent oxidoreductase [bacterium]